MTRAEAKRLSDSSIASADVPLQGLLRHGPASERCSLRPCVSNLALPHRPKVEEEAVCASPKRSRCGGVMSTSTGRMPHLKVRRAIVRKPVEPPKTHRGMRQVPLSANLGAKFRAHYEETEWPGADDFVFC
jgi:hypothetical protein